MGRQVRKVPKDWEHPKNEAGRYKPLHDQSYIEASQHWKDGYEKWETEPKSDCEYWEWEEPPDFDCHRPDWSDDEATHYMMYETITEGTPISPAFETPEELARWLVDHDANAGAGVTATYEFWLRVCLEGYAPSLVIYDDGRKESGVEGLSEP
jgi:hypothetical protein